MSDFLDDAFEPIIISKSELIIVLHKISKLWPESIVFEDKQFALDAFTCRSIIKDGQLAREKFECENWGDKEELAGIALDFFGLAVKASSKYLRCINVADIDLDMIICNISARDDVIVRE